MTKLIYPTKVSDSALKLLARFASERFSDCPRLYGWLGEWTTAERNRRAVCAALPQEPEPVTIDPHQWETRELSRGVVLILTSARLVSPEASRILVTVAMELGTVLHARVSILAKCLPELDERFKSPGESATVDPA
jgi:hypothetical protein